MSVATDPSLVRPASLDEIEIEVEGDGVLLAGGTEVVPQLRDGLLRRGRG